MGPPWIGLAAFLVLGCYEARTIITVRDPSAMHLDVPPVEPTRDLYGDALSRARGIDPQDVEHASADWLDAHVVRDQEPSLRYALRTSRVIQRFWSRRVANWSPTMRSTTSAHATCVSRCG